MLVMVVFFIAFRWIHLSTPLIRLFLLVLILLLMPTLNFLPVWFALSLLRFRLPSRLPMMFILWMVAMMVSNALRDYFRDIGRMVLAAEGRKANDSHADCYQYFCVPEYGTANGRLHFHAVHFMRTLPTGSVDPNFGRRVRNRRQLNS